MSKWCNGHETDVASYNLDRNVSCKVFEINMNLFAVYLLNGSMKWNFILIHFIRKSVKNYLFKRLSINEICSKASYLSSFSTGSCIWNIKKVSLWFRFCNIKDFLPFNIRHRKHRSGSFFVFLVDKKNSEFFHLHLPLPFFFGLSSDLSSLKKFMFILAISHTPSTGAQSPFTTWNVTRLWSRFVRASTNPNRFVSSDLDHRWFS